MKTSCPGAHPENQEQDNRPQHAQPGQNISSNPIHEPNQPSPKPMIKTESLLRFTAGKKEEYPGNIEDYYDMREQIGKFVFFSSILKEIFLKLRLNIEVHFQWSKKLFVEKMDKYTQLK